MINTLNKIKNGAFFAVAWTTDISDKMKASYKGTHKIEKTTQTVCRKGISPCHISTVIQNKGTNAAMQPRSWATDVIHNLIIKSNKTDKELLVLYTAPNKAKVSYLFDGKPISRDELMKKGVIVDSYWNPVKKSYVITVPVSSIKQIKTKNIIWEA